MATKVATCGFRLRLSKISLTQFSLRCLSEASNTKFVEDADQPIEDVKKDPIYPLQKLVDNYLERTNPILDYGSIYKKYPNAKKALVGEIPEKRMVWEELDCSKSFPESPEAANLDLLNFLEQRDMWQRHQNLEVPKFCVGSIVAVTRADRFAPEGSTRFVGLCIHKNFSQNNKGANFILRNVLQGQPLEIQYPIYSPLIQKIEVLRHQKWENEKPFIGLRFLRDFPPEYSTVNVNLEPETYTEEPSIRIWTQDDKEKIIKWFEAVFESRRRR